jgi:hypothetical protein
MALIKDNILEPGQQLGKPERYFLEIMKIPNLEQKMNIWTVMRTFDSLYYDCEKVGKWGLCYVFIVCFFKG